MQTTGYMMIDGQKVLVLIRRERYGVAVKLRRSGREGVHLTDEEAHLRENPDLVAALHVGSVLHL